jgi:terminase, large subunit
MLTPSNDRARVYRAEAARWLTPEDIARLGGSSEIRHRFVFSRPERQALRRRRYVRPSEWAPRERIMTEGMFAGNAMNMSITPYAGPIMDAAVEPCVRQVAICAAPQTAKTTIIHTILGWLAQFAPGPILGIYPKEVQGKEHMVDRITGMFRQSPTLRKLLTWRKQDMTDTLLRLATLWWRIGWSGSAASLADRSARYVDAQEVDKYEDRPNRKETGVLELIKVRTRFFSHNYKIFYSSSPTVESGNIWTIISRETQAVFIGWVRCPHCLEYQVMEFSKESWWWPHDAEGHSIDRKEILARKLARYICRHCGAEWTDHDRNRAIQHIVFRHVEDLRMLTGETEMAEGEEMRRYMRQHRPASIGFILPSWISYQVSLSEVAHDFLRAQDKELDAADRFKAYQDFQNKHRALPWRIEIKAADDKAVLQAVGVLPRAVAPQEAVALTCGIDVQKYGFWYVVRAWAPDYTSWLIQYGSLATWADVEALLFEARWPVDGTRRQVGIWRAGVDTGGGKGEGLLTMTEETYFWLRRNGIGRGCRVWGTKGSSTPLAGKLQVGKPLDKSPSGRPIPGGLQIIRLNTDELKDTVTWRRDQAVLGGEMAAWLHAGTGDDYARQITAEARHIDDKGRASWVKLRADNHLLDCEVIAHALADPEWPGGGVNLLPPPGTAPRGRRERSAGVGG